MAFFTQGTAANGSAANPASAARRRADQSGLSIVSQDLVITGDLEAAGVIKIEGRVVGVVRAGGQVLLSAGAQVEGDIHTAEAVIGGEVRGGIHASERVEIQPSAVVHGDIHTSRLLIHEGGQVNGNVMMKLMEEAALAAP